MSAFDFTHNQSIKDFVKKEKYVPQQLGSKIILDEEPEESTLVILGVEDGRNSKGNEGSAKAPNKIRKELYKLFSYSNDLLIYDIGNIEQGKTVMDTVAAVRTTCNDLYRKNCTVIILGGAHWISYGQFEGYDKLEQQVNFLNIDSRLDLEDEEELGSQSHIFKTLCHPNGILFNFCHLGYQTYLTNPEHLNVLDKLQFDALRLGEAQEQLHKVEPLIRDADMIAFDISAIRYSDAPANFYASPHGFYGEEACQLFRYAGMNEKLSSIGIYELEPTIATSNQCMSLAAQLAWHFIDGYLNRQKDDPMYGKENFVRFRTIFDKTNEEIVFYKSKKTDRWWMQVPTPNQPKNALYQLIPCNYEDYLQAANEEVPDKWLKLFNKLS
jgi:formiminoglutamase